MNQQIQRIRKTFAESITSVSELLNFDRTILDFSISNVAELSDKLKNQHGITNPYLSAQSTLKMLENIRDNNSLRIRYKRVFNQCLVLLVSHFSSTLRDLFQSAINEALKTTSFDKVHRVKIEVTLSDLQNDIEKTRSIGEIMITQKDISFQDMQSIARAFSEYFAIEIPKDQDVNNIILAQACRHAIVHSGAHVDRRLLNQVSNAKPRSIKNDIELGSEILFSPEEVQDVGASMNFYLETAFSQLNMVFGGT